MSREQIEEMEQTLRNARKVYVYSKDIAEHLYNADYRKQKRGEWMARGNGKIESAYFPIVECSECHITFCDLINNHYFMYRYCPYCGAKMKGGAE